MKPDTTKYPVYNYPDILIKYFFQEETGEGRSPESTCPEYLLIFVYSGKLTIQHGRRRTTIHKGEYIFLRKDISIKLIRKSDGEEAFNSVFIGFNHSFLRDFHRRMDKKGIPRDTDVFTHNIIQLPKNPYMESLYVSLLPYLHWNAKPLDQIVEIKLKEAVLSLLLTDNRFYNCLFDFPDNTDAYPIITATDSFVQHMSINLFPGHHQCMISKRLQTAYIRLKEESNATNLYLEVGYKNVAHLVKVF